MISPFINILILNWNGQKVLLDCVQSILQSDYKKYCITIIDNGSIDSSLESITALNSDIINFIKINQNVGYAKAYNYAFEKIINNKDDFYFILNNDTVIESNTLSQLILALNKYGDNNIYGPKIINFFDRTIWYAGGTLNPYTFSANNIGINKIDSITEYKIGKTDFVSGCALFIKKDILNKIGGFNKIYRFYYEDVDLCLKARSLNVNSFFVNNSVVKHKISHSMGGRYSILKFYLKTVSKIKFIFSNNSFFKSILYLLINILLLPFLLFYKIIIILLK